MPSPASRPQTWCALFFPVPFSVLPGRSYNCGQKGHIAGRCLNAVKFHLCGEEEGHISKQCTTAGQTKRTCYNCGSSAHLVADCTEQWTPAPQRQSGHKVPSVNE
ncbi:hypothetical protein B0H17DRAFT_1208483 [Mycena rosella]|uniref:CCHC-type domain-containing protein n=1 Tax=Mycena rosella TaxID=1033263 RepID=A0AAD7GAR6_MYCRO|nr:hypothetical protein B0H17DRAFT_1208483 [Mycena rosella]